MQIIAGGVPLGEDFYKGRLKSVEELRNEVKKNDVLLIGPRRTGKTSVIKEYLRQENSNKKNFYSIFIDLEKAQNLYEFYFLILKAVYQKCNRWKLLANNGKDFVQSLSNLCSQIFENGFDTSTILGLPEGSGLSIKFPKFDSSEQQKIRLLATKLHDELKNIKEEITIVLDEFPELIWKFGQTEKEEEQFSSRKLQTQYLLEGLRALRQEGDDRTKHIILAGSVNLPNTLKHLGLEHTINDLYRLNIPYLTEEESYDLMSQLIKGNDIEVTDQTFFEGAIKKQMGVCSPFYIQILAESMVQLTVDRGGNNKFSNDDIKLCYKNALIGDKGPVYLKERIKKYYTKNSEKVEKIIEIVAKEQFQNKKHTKESALNETLKEQSMTREQISTLMAKMSSDDLIQFLGQGDELGFRSQILCNFWNYIYIDSRFWYDA